jgi:hypothetical protein
MASLCSCCISSVIALIAAYVRRIVIFYGWNIIFDSQQFQLQERGEHVGPHSSHSVTLVSIAAYFQTVKFTFAFHRAELVGKRTLSLRDSVVRLD